VSAWLEVLDGGLLTSVQDRGRPGARRYGLSASGAVDEWAYAWSNRLAGNPPGAAVLEATLVGPCLRVHGDAIMAVAGADLGVSVDGEEVPPGTAVAVRSGAMVASGQARRGVRAYLAFQGGIAVPPVLGSRSTDLAGGIGPAPLRVGDRVPVGDVPPSRAGRTAEDTCRLTSVVRVLPHGALADAEGLLLSALLHDPIEVSWRSDRVALRGHPAGGGAPAAASLGGAWQGVSVPMVTGAVQITPDGERLVLLAGHGTLGGYPVPAVVIRADWPALAQVTPGRALSFTAVTRDQAVSAWADMVARWTEAAGEPESLGSLG
jgi:biotin-dependent carboxylase-like uncharacterized protein